MRILIILSVIFVLSGCATAYQPRGYSGGYSETQIDENVFTVSFIGNGYTGRERSNDFALLRSAELTLANGFNYFAIIDGQQYSRTSAHTTPTTATTTVNANTYGTSYNYGNSTSYNANTYGTATTTVSGGQTYYVSKPRTSNTIVCFTEKPEGFSYNAAFIVKSLRAKYGFQDAPNK